MDLLFARPYQLAEFRILHRIRRDLCHVLCRGVMIRVGHAVRIDEMGMRGADFLRLRIHEVREAGEIAGNRFSDRRCRAVIRDQHHLIPELAKSNPFAAVQRRRFDISSIPAHLDRIVGRRFFKRKNRRHDLCHAGRIFLLRPVLFVQEHLGSRIVNDSGIRCDFRSRRKSAFDGEKKESKKRKEDFARRFHKTPF